jgi:hypothetical protein
MGAARAERPPTEEAARRLDLPEYMRDYAKVLALTTVNLSRRDIPSSGRRIVQKLKTSGMVIRSMDTFVRWCPANGSPGFFPCASFFRTRDHRADRQIRAVEWYMHKVKAER